METRWTYPIGWNGQRSPKMLSMIWFFMVKWDEHELFVMALVRFTSSTQCYGIVTRRGGFVSALWSCLDVQPRGARYVEVLQHGFSRSQPVCSFTSQSGRVFPLQRLDWGVRMGFWGLWRGSFYSLHCAVDLADKRTAFDEIMTDVCVCPLFIPVLLLLSFLVSFFSLAGYSSFSLSPPPFWKTLRAAFIEV